MPKIPRMISALPTRVFRFYAGGFREMTVGRTLWIIIAVKAVILFGILKIFFFPDFLATEFETDNARADHVLDNLTEQTDDP